MTEQLSAPTPKQREYLADLLGRARKLGMPRIETEDFTRDETSAWIKFLAPVVPREERKPRTEVARKEEGSTSSPSLPFGLSTRHVIERVNHDERSHYLLTPPRSKAPDGYRPAWDAAPRAWDHEHRIDTYATEDLHDVIYCTVCSQEW